MASDVPPAALLSAVEFGVAGEPRLLLLGLEEMPDTTRIEERADDGGGAAAAAHDGGAPDATSANTQLAVARLLSERFRKSARIPPSVCVAATWPWAAVALGPPRRRAPCPLSSRRRPRLPSRHPPLARQQALPTRICSSASLPTMPCARTPSPCCVHASSSRPCR